VLEGASEALAETAADDDPVATRLCDFMHVQRLAGGWVSPHHPERKFTLGESTPFLEETQVAPAGDRIRAAADAELAEDGS
jgi:hypothetical protein